MDDKCNKANIKNTDPKDWRTVANIKKKLCEGEHFYDYSMEYPKEWKMDLFPNPIGKVHLVARDPIFMISRQLMNPNLAYGNLDKIRFKAYQDINADGERCHGDVMSSEWAEKTEQSMRQRSPRGTLLPISLYSDGVAVGKGNRQVTTTMGSCGLFTDDYQNKLEAKFCLGYQSKLPCSEDELVYHLRTRCGYTSDKSARSAIKHFEKMLRNKHWAMILSSINKHNENGNLINFLLCRESYLSV